MMRLTNQKLKLHYLEKILREQTDENHSLSIAEITERLAAYGILVERKTLYADLECLQLAGLDIHVTKGRCNRYALVSREFELPELKLLVDAVQSCRFITEKKSRALIRKLEGLTSVHEAKRMARQVFIYRRVKSSNESVYYTIDALNTAISSGKKVRFRYFEYAPNKRRRLKNNGAYYVVSPHALCWDDEYYYLICTYPVREGFTHFRVDKILDISLLDEPSENPEDFDPAEYSRQTFSMFGGPECQATLRFENSLIGVAIDRFGSDIPVRPDGDHFITYINVTKSPTFYGWMFQLGNQAEILAPDDLREGMLQHVCAVARLYGC
ncbi:MAG: helix-turn-helix transcriptional regulator [Christensenellales bacterium]|jgi:predicted DNA-binding transcriptional regulator YafY